MCRFGEGYPNPSFTLFPLIIRLSGFREGCEDKKDKLLEEDFSYKKHTTTYIFFTPSFFNYTGDGIFCSTFFPHYIDTDKNCTLKAHAEP